MGAGGGLRLTARRAEENGMDPNTLKDCAIQLRYLAQEGERWLSDNEEAQGAQPEERKNLRRAGRRLANLAQAAGSKMGIAVFGPSQAGKSTLISALAKPQRGKLMVDFQGTKLDFINQVNPTGGKETTGLVTRFTTDDPPRSPKDSLPVCLRIFSEMDVLKILANTYFSEGQGAEKLDPDEIAGILEELSRKQGSPARAPSLDDLEDYQEYVFSLSKHLAAGDILARSFWPGAIQLAQKLEIKDRARLFSCVWGGLDEFTRLYVKLYEALGILGFPETAFTSIKAIYDQSLEPDQDGRSKSVLHVDRLEGILSPDDGDLIPVVAPDGRGTELSRPVLCALISEMHAKVSEKPEKFMDNADILDFPGYRSRSKYDNFREAIKKPTEIKNCFLRGKVAYAFQRYCAHKEITVMLLCIKDSNMEIADLPEVVNAWISDAHGGTPEERWERPVCLFFVLTFFNVHFQRGEGEKDLSKIWENRLSASISQPFQKSEWPLAWARKGSETFPFRNCFWLLNVFRSINYLTVSAVALGGGEEKDIPPNFSEPEDPNTAYIAKGVRPDMVPWMGSLRSAFLKSAEVRKFFQEPEAAWDRAVGSPDGGCDYIIDKLNPILERDIKTAQLRSLAILEGKLIYDTLGYFYQGGSSEEEAQGKRTLFRRLDKTLTKLGNPGSVDRVQALFEGTPWHRFGLFLRDLTFSDDQCYELFTRPESIPLQERLPEAAGGPEGAAEPQRAERADDPASEEDILSLFEDPEEPPAAKPGAPAPGGPGPLAARADDKATYYRRILDSEWQASLERLATSPQKLRYYGFDAKDLKSLILELKSGSQRLGLMKDIEDQIRLATAYANVNQESMIWILSRIASATLSDFVNYLGYSPRRKPDKKDRTISISGKSYLLFEGTRIQGEYPTLPALPPAYEKPFHTHWRLALFQLMIDNVYFAEKTYNVRENDRLGGIRGKVGKNNLSLTGGPPKAAAG
jgi:hypothetical protein